MRKTNGDTGQNQSAPGNAGTPEIFPDLKALSPGELLEYAEKLQKENRRLDREKRRLQNKLENVDRDAGASGAVKNTRTGEQQKLEKYMKLVLENLPNVFIFLDRNARVVYCTHTFLKFMNIDNFEFMNGRHLEEVYRMFGNEELTRSRVENFERIKRTGQRQEAEISINFPAINGQRTFLIQSIPFTDEHEEFDGIFSIFYDTTSIKNAEEDARTRLMLDATPLACSLWDWHNNLIDCNKEALRLFGAKSKEDLKSFYKQMPKYQPDGTVSNNLMHKMAVAAYKKGSAVFEWTYQTSDGKPLYLESTFVRVPWKNKSCLAAYSRDLTEIKTNKRMAQEAEEYNSLMLEGIPLACILFDEKFNILTSNSEALQLYGFDNNTTFLKDFFKFSPEFQPDGGRSEERRIERLKEAVNTGFVVFEWLHHRVDGSDLPLEVTLVKLPWKSGFRIASYSRDLRAYKAQEELARQAEERTKVMLNAMPIACLFMDAAGNVYDCNSAAVTLFNANSKEDYLEHFYDYYMPEFQPSGLNSKTEAENRVKAAIAAGGLRFEWTHCTARGKFFPAEVTLVRVDWQNTWHIAVYIQDITEIKETEQRIRKANERTRVMLDAMPMACVFIDEAGNAIDCNAEAPRLFNVRFRQEFLEKFYDFMPEFQPGGMNSLAEIHRRIQDAIKTGYGNSQWMHLTASGEKLPAEVIMVRVEWNGIFCVATYIRDMRTLYEKEKEIQKAEQEVLLKKQHLDVMANISKFAYWELNGEDDLIFSPHFEHQFGYNADEIHSLGFNDRTVRYPPSKWIDILHPEDIERNLRDIDDYFSGVTNYYRSEVRIRHKITGEYMWAISAGLATEWQDGRPVVMIGGLFNIDDIKRTESAANAKTQFLASMSHEVRTPMNAIIGMSDLMRTDNLDARQKEFFSDIKKMSKALLQIINDILDFSKIEAGKMDLLPVNFNLSELLNNIVSMHRFTAQSKGLNFKFSIDANIPSVIYGDDIRIRQIVTNLLSNAIKYTKEGTVCFRVEYIRKNNTNYIAFIVEDTGIGIRKEDIARIFDSFEQLDNRQNRGIAGTGLGLPITKKLTEMMNGRIDIKSEYGKGATFTVLLPLKQGDTLTAEKTEAGVRVTANEEVNVLVVDDNLVNIKVAVAYLATHNIKADTAQSGPEAIRKAKQKEYHLIFMDHMMSGMDGLETTRRIRTLGGWYKSSPIIALTANAVSGAKELFFKNEMNDFLPKPIDANELNRILAKWLPPDMIFKGVKNAVNYAYSSTDGQNLIDKNTGLLYAAGDEALYTELLKDFSSAHRQDIQKIQTAMDTGDLKSARLIAHTLKSSSALIGAKQLSAAALVAETVLSGEQTLSNEEMDKLKMEFSAVTVKLGQMLEQQPLKNTGGVQAGESPPAEAAPDKAAVLALTKKLMPLLKNSSTSVLNLKDDIQKFFAPVGEDCKTLLKLIDDFDFGEASVVLEKIIEELGVDNL
jgi:signal transduction histidine kinase/CheY-like chemotaxis protein/transcriptional regulator with PAS, ATPase and Fis domain/HPt (histidine-containing phosphotransfer) domain-containing protein